MGALEAEDTGTRGGRHRRGPGLLIAPAAGPLAGTPAGRVTQIIAAVVGRLGGVDLVLTGQAGLTDGTGSLAPRVAAMLGWPSLLDAVRLTDEGGGLTASVATDGGGRVVPS